MTISWNDVEKGTQMYKREITYEDLDGNEVTDTFYFNLTKTELMTMGAEYPEGYEQVLQKIIRTNGQAALIVEFKKIILASYGVRGEDGKRFIKNDEVREAFSQTGAFDVLFMEFATDEKKAAEFVNAVFPKDIAETVAQEMAKTPPAPSFPGAGAVGPTPLAPPQSA